MEPYVMRAMRMYITAMPTVDINMPLGSVLSGSFTSPPAFTMAANPI